MSALTLADAKEHLNIPDSVSDAEIQTFINAAESAVAQRVGPLVSTSKTLRVRGGATALLVAPPVISLTSVTPVGGTALTVSDLVVDFAAGIIEYAPTTGFWFGQDWYDVVYDAGRAVCPPDLLMAVKLHLRDLWTTQRGKGGQLSTTAGSQLPPAGTFPGASRQFRPEVEALIASHVPMPGFA